MKCGPTAGHEVDWRTRFSRFTISEQDLLDTGRIALLRVHVQHRDCRAEAAETLGQEM